MSALALPDIHTDARQYPRIGLNRTAHLAAPDGRAIKVTVLEVSPDGVLIACNRDTMRNLIPPGGLGAQGASPVEVRMNLELPLAGEDRVFNAVCVAMHVSANHQAGYAVGMRFQNLGRGGREIIDAFVAESLAL